MNAIPDDALLEGLAGAGVHAISLQRQPGEYRTSYPIETVDAVLADGTTLPLLLKDLAWESLTTEGRAAKPDYLHEPAREIELYRRWLPQAPSGPPRLWASSINPPWILLERIDGRELYQVGEFSEWQRVAQWLGRFHRWGGTQHCGFALARSASEESPDSSLALRANKNDHRIALIEFTADYYQSWMQRALRFVPRSHREYACLQDLAKRYEGVIRNLMRLPATLLHGEFYASNVLVTPDRVCPVDWEMTAHGPGLTDVAALTAGEWSDAERDAMLMAYCEGWGEPARFAEFHRGLKWCRLAVAIQWLGWSDDWQPPEQHAHDWLTEAIELADTLGV